MTKIDPIIAVRDVTASSLWYQTMFGFMRQHGGNEFAVLVSGTGEVMLCLHKWGTHGHPTMINQNISPGNGLILYFRTKNIDSVRKNVENLGDSPEEDIHFNPNSMKKEFSVRDPDGYFLTVSEFHEYNG